MALKWKAVCGGTGLECMLLLRASWTVLQASWVILWLGQSQWLYWDWGRVLQVGKVILVRCLEMAGWSMVTLGGESAWSSLRSPRKELFRLVELCLGRKEFYDLIQLYLGWKRVLSVGKVILREWSWNGRLISGDTGKETV